MYLQLFDCLFRSLYFILFPYTEKQFDKHIIYCCESLRKVNVLYIKIFQAISANTSIPSQTVSNYLMTFTDNVPYNLNEININKLSYNLKLFNIDLINNQPIASGSIAYVFKGIQNNKYVAIKVKRNNIEQIVQKSIDDLRFLCKILNFIPHFSRTNALAILENNIEFIHEQCNFLNEWENIELVYNKNKNNNKFITPKPYNKELVQLHDLIIMDWLDGTNIQELNNENKNNAFNLLVSYGIKSIFYDQYIHGDLHQGNCKYDICNNKLIIYDFGMICKLTKDEVDIMYNFGYLMYSKNATECANFIIKQGLYHADGRHILYPSTLMVNDLTGWFSNIMTRYPLNFNYNDVNILSDILSKHELISIKWLNKLLLSMAINEALAVSLQNDTSYLEYAKKYFLN